MSTMPQYQLSILTPLGECFKGQVSSVVAQGHSGRFGILAGHQASIMMLNKGVMKITSDENKDLFFAHASGILEVKNDHNVLVLVDDAFEVKDVFEGKEKLAAMPGL